MSNIIAGNGGSGRGVAAATAITVALILMMISSPAILATTTTEAFAAPLKSKKDCKDIQFRTFEQDFASGYSGKTVTIGTSQHEYSVKIDYFRVMNDDRLCALLLPFVFALPSRAFLTSQHLLAHSAKSLFLILNVSS
jgi:hypothetical protein